MAATNETPSAGPDRHWFIVGRWQEYAGESRANLLRIAGIGAFYLVELANYRLGVVEPSFHHAVTALALAWAMVSLGVLFSLGQHIFPALLKFLSTAADVVLLTSILVVADGPKSPLVVGYFLLIVLSTLRFSLGLVWFATLGSMAGYLCLLAYARWFAEPERQLSVPRYHQAIFLLGLALTGIVLGQVIRRVRKMAHEYLARIEASRGQSQEMPK